VGSETGQRAASSNDKQRQTTINTILTQQRERTGETNEKHASHGDLSPSRVYARATTYHPVCFVYVSMNTVLQIRDAQDVAQSGVRDVNDDAIDRLIDPRVLPGIDGSGHSEDT
jgi:hypothetical protein